MALPVLNEVSHQLFGMVVRGGMEGDVCLIRYIDVFVIILLLEAVIVGHEATDYNKRLSPSGPENTR